MISFSYLKTRLVDAVPTKDGYPTDAQFTQAVVDAVADYSRHCPIERYSEIEVVAGTDSYDLPDDFLSVTEITLPYTGSGVIHSEEGLIVVGQRWTLQYAIAGKTLSFQDEPTFSVTLSLKYAAEHVQDANNDYTYMTRPDAEIIMCKAQANALMILANHSVLDAWSYSIEGERVSKERLSAAIREQAEAQEKMYQERLLQHLRGLGMRSVFTSAEEDLVEGY